MRLFRPLPRTLTRPVSFAALIAWVAVMAVLVNRSYIQAAPTNLATDLARYGPTAVWRGLYYRGEKIGFTVSQTVRTDQGFELQEDGRLQMLLFGQDSAATLHTSARVDEQFALESFEFSLDPGTGAIQVRGTVEPSNHPQDCHYVRRRHTHRRAATARGAGDDVEPLARAGEPRHQVWRQLSVDDLRSRHAEERTG